MVRKENELHRAEREKETREREELESLLESYRNNFKDMVGLVQSNPKLKHLLS